MGMDVKLNTGDAMPSVGFGTWQLLPGRTARNAVTAAVDTGYRLVDTARIYGNETSVGKAVAASGVPRKDIFVTTKLWNASQGYDKARKAFKNSLKRLSMDYVDLYLIHWPISAKRSESWRALCELYESGKAKNIGVSNYTIRHLQELLSESNIVPAVNQIEFHPFLYEEQRELLDFCKQHDIVVEAYSPLAHGKTTDNQVLPAIAQKHGKSTAQVILRWCVQHGTIPLPKSSNPDHIRDNLDIFDFELTKDDMGQINGLSEGTRTCWDPNNMV
jgi:diketogulonate reductase-like aldo/keto reductase